MRSQKTRLSDDPAYAERFLAYPDAPTKRAYVGIAKKPLMPTSTGIGFLGVLLQNEARNRVQCYECGSWMKIITSLHLNKCCGITSIEYREKHGLNKSNGLCSDMTSLRYTKNALEANPENRLKYAFKPGQSSRNFTKRTTERENQHGTCPEQIKDRLFQFIADNRELPSQGNKGRPLYKILIARFGSFGKGLAHYGLPVLARRGTTMYFTFPDETTYKYNLNQWYNREELFTMISQKCPALLPYLHPINHLPE